MALVTRFFAEDADGRVRDVNGNKLEAMREIKNAAKQNDISIFLYERVGLRKRISEYDGLPLTEWDDEVIVAEA